ncbi:hypothetical protein DPEC_G00052250 [Dallia pectoralis]|uniref:Uncharacterized protein n=1 Tax=Dallia pectoralis TaxID=75939 RepID=A0ACC2HCB9_DALPE|nr:hypothetical protein DPEC_G00052250 [Dallia pectoralis]
MSSRDAWILGLLEQTASPRKHLGPWDGKDSLRGRSEALISQMSGEVWGFAGRNATSETFSSPCGKTQDISNVASVDEQGGETMPSRGSPHKDAGTAASRDSGCFRGQSQRHMEQANLISACFPPLITFPPGFRCLVAAVCLVGVSPDSTMPLPQTPPGGPAAPRHSLKTGERIVGERGERRLCVSTGIPRRRLRRSDCEPPQTNPVAANQIISSSLFMLCLLQNLLY